MKDHDEAQNGDSHEERTTIPREIAQKEQTNTHQN